MTMLLAWLLMPVLLGVLSLGCGLLLEQLVGRPLPGSLLLPCGFAVMIASAALTTVSPRTASLTVPVVVAEAVIGFGLAYPFRRRADGWCAAAAIVIFVVYAAPIVLSGHPTFSGYISLDDTATWLAMSDRILDHGRSLSGLQPSTYSVVLGDNLGGGYPIGAFLPLAIGHKLTGVDPAWLIQPEMAFVAVLLCLSIYSIALAALRRRALAFCVAALAAQPAILFGYTFWSGIKELTAAALIALAAALAGDAWHGGIRPLLAPVVAGAALLAVLSAGGVIWLLAVGAVVVSVAIAHGFGAVRGLAALLAGAIVLVTPELKTASMFVGGVVHGDITSKTQLGNLYRPLNALQVFGIWPVKDFRLRPDLTPVYGVVLLSVLLVAVALWWSWRRRVWALLLYLVSSVVGFGVVRLADVVGHGSPWLDGKAIAEASPAVLAAAAVGASLLVMRLQLRPLGIALLAALVVSVGWSNILAYGGVWLAPYGQLRELQAIGSRFAGDGPTLLTEQESYGPRHFLRALDAEGASERRTRPVNLRIGGYLAKGEYADLDEFTLDAVLVYRTLVLRSSPVESRPPSVYRLVYSGHWYEVWQRPLQPRQILAHLSLGSADQPGAVPKCSAIRSLAAQAASAGGSLLAVPRVPAQRVDLGVLPHPAGWAPAGTEAVVPHGSGGLAVAFRLPHAGPWGVWLGGSVPNRVRVAIDGETVGTITQHLEWLPLLTPVGETLLTGGTHHLDLSYSGIGLAPGRHAGDLAFGPVELGRSSAASRVVSVSPRAATSLCGRYLDWVEAVAS